MGCCKQNSKRYLTLLNALIILVGLGVLGLGIYGIIEQREVLDNISKYAAYTPIALGVLVVLVAGFGLYGARQQNKVMLISYFFFAFAFMVLLISIGVIVLIYVGLLDDFDRADPQLDQALAEINDFEMAVYRDCCIGQDLTNESIPVCDDSLNITIPGCVADPEDFSNLEIADSFCRALEEIKIDGVAVVGTASCTSPEAFSDLFRTYLEGNLTPIGITLIVLSVLMVLCVIATCVLICSNREDYDKEYAKRKEAQNQKGGPVVAYG